MPPTPVDTVIHADWVIPVDADNSVHREHAVVIDDGRIIDIAPGDQAREKYQGLEEHALSRHALLPGFINAHTHAAMSLLRGFADDIPLMQWLQERIWPVERRWAQAQFVRDGARLAIAEMIRGGTTAFADMYFFPEQTAEAAAEAGLRCSIGMIMLDFPTPWAADSREYLDKGLQMHDKYKHSPLLKTMFAPHAPYTVSDQPLQKIVTLAEQLDAQIQMHIHETAAEIEQSLETCGARPLQRLQGLGLLSPRLMAVHMTQLKQHEIEAAAKYALSVVHCPESNLKLASGFCPVRDLAAAGVNVALGTDGAASNNDLDMLGEMRSAALLGKAVARDCAAVAAAETLRMATINGARALAIHETTGSIEKGKDADLIAIDLSPPETQPLSDPVSQIVYAAGREQVTHVWVAGKPLLKERELLTVDLPQTLNNAQQWRKKIATAR